MNTPSSDQRRADISTTRRRMLLALLLFVGVLGYGGPRLILFFAANPNYTLEQTPQSVFETYQSRARWLRLAGWFPWNHKATTGAEFKLFARTSRHMRTQRAIRPEIRTESMSLHVYLSPRRIMGSHTLIRELCKAGQFGSIESLLSPKMDLLRLALLDLDECVTKAALLTGQTARLAWLSQRKSLSPRLSSPRNMRQRLLPESERLVMTGQLKPALALLERGKGTFPAHSLKQQRVDHLRCALRLALASTPPNKPPFATPSCLARTIWAHLRIGQVKQATQLIKTISQPLQKRQYPTLFFAQASVLATQKQWPTLRQKWTEFQRTHAPTRMVTYNDPYHMFQRIYHTSLPPSLLARLQSHLENHLLQPRVVFPELSSFLQWIRLFRAQQAVLFGRPKHAIKQLQHLNGHPRWLAIRNAQILPLQGLLSTPQAALDAHKRNKQLALSPLLQQTYALLAGQTQRARQLHRQHPMTCTTLQKHHRRLCLLLKLHLVRDKTTYQRTRNVHQRKGNTRLYALNETLIRHQSKQPAHQRALLYPHIDNVDPDLRALWVLLQLVDTKGTRTLPIVRMWQLATRKNSPQGQLLITYLLERRARRHHAPNTTHKQLQQQRQHWGQIIRRYQDLWLPLP